MPKARIPASGGKIRHETQTFPQTFPHPSSWHLFDRAVMSRSTIDLMPIEETHKIKKSIPL